MSKSSDIMQTNSQRIDREKWLDFVRGVAIVLIVLGHCCERINSTYEVSVLMPFRDILYLIHLPLFFCVSGYLYRAREANTSLKEFLPNKLLDLFAPYVFWGILIWVGKYFLNDYVSTQVTINNLLEMFYQPATFAWFLYILFIISILGKLLDMISSSLNINDSIIPCIISIIFICLYCFVLPLFPEIKIISRVCMYFPFYFLGIQFQKIKTKVSDQIILISFLVLFVLFALAIMIHFIFPQVLFLDYLGSLSGTFSIFLVAYYFKNKLNSEVLFCSLGKASIYIYILHPFILNALIFVFRHVGFDIVPIIFGFFMIIGIGIPFVYFILATKIPIFDIIFRPRSCIKRLKKSSKSKEAAV